jgi:hypothetical protein
MKPAQLSDQFRGEFDAFRVDGKAPLIDSAFPRDHIQVATRGPGEKNVPPVVFDFFEAAEAAPAAGIFPVFSVFDPYHGLRIPNNRCPCQSERRHRYPELIPGMKLAYSGLSVISRFQKIRMEGSVECPRKK